MRKFMIISAFALGSALTPALLHAQDAAAPAASAAPSGPFTMTTDQKTQYDGWAAGEKTKYDAWPSAQQEYFWSLDADQQKGWWALNETQRGQVLAMTPDQRAQVWPSIVAQVKGRATASAAPAAAAKPTAAAEPAPQATAPGGAGEAYASADTGKTYPVCSRTITDSCRNRNGV